MLYQTPSFCIKLITSTTPLLQVHSHVDVYNFTSNQWGQSFATPKQMANSHLGMATDGRYIYVVSGQQGPQCRTPPVAETFVLDTQTRTWDSFPPLPEPRYARLSSQVMNLDCCIPKQSIFTRLPLTGSILGWVSSQMG